jgi:hypothetical protein
VTAPSALFLPLFCRRNFPIPEEQEKGVDKNNNNDWMSNFDYYLTYLVMALFIPYLLFATIPNKPDQVESEKDRND